MTGRNDKIAAVVDHLRRVIQVVHGHSKRSRSITGLTAPQLWAIRVLVETGPARITDLARRMYLHPSTIVGVVDRLEAQDLVRRARKSADRRVVTVHLTRAGRAVAGRVPAAVQELLLMGLESLPARSLDAVHGGLTVLVDFLGAQHVTPKPFFAYDVETDAAQRGAKRTAKRPAKRS